MTELAMRTLINKLHKYDNLYNAGTPAISDKEYDDLYFELKKMEEQSGCIFPDSPTQSIHYEVKNSLTKVEHNHPLLSLDKTKSIEDLNEFIGDKHYTVMAKMDGLTISVRYLNGELVSAETRGNGIIGEDVLHNARVIKNLPQHIKYKEELIIDGEAIIDYDDFTKFEKTYANPRNLVAGSMRLLDSEEAAKRNIKFIAWKVYKGFDEEEWYSQKLRRLIDLGFTVVPHINDDDYDQIIEPHDLESLIEEIRVDCEAYYAYPIDGCVIGIDNIKEAAAMGEATSHHEKYQVAYKFYDEEYDTYLKNIEYDVSRTGILTPVAIFKAVDDGESVFSRASLSNISVMEQTLGKYPYESQPIKVAKMNMIIPKVVSAEKNDEEIDLITLHIPHKCHICGGDTEIRQDGVAKILYCTNPHCPGKFSEQVRHYCSKKGLDIKGLSEKTIDKLIEWGWLNSIKDIYNLKHHRGEWCKKSGFGAASVDKILAAIEEKTALDLKTFIPALGIPEVGTTVGKDLSKRFHNDWEEFRSAVDDPAFRFDDFSGYGWVMNQKLKDFDYSEADYIVNHYFKIIDKNANPEEKNETVTISGLTFVVTGKLQEFKNRDALIADIEAHGGKVSGAVSAKTNYLINNDINSTSAKNKKAKDLNIPIITEAEYKRLAQGQM